MNKTDLINSIASKSGLNKKTVKQLNASGSVEEALVKGDKVVLVDLEHSKSGREPQGRQKSPIKKEIQIPASKAPVFKAGKVCRMQ